MVDAQDDDDIARWDRVAAVYAETIGESGDSFFRRLQPFLAEQVGDVHGRRVLDLGCGHGWLSGILAAAGAVVVGVDGSSALVDLARGRHPELRFEVADLTRGLPAGFDGFDVVLCHMVLMDLPELDVLFADVARALRPGAVFVASILHPAYFSHDVDKAVDPRPWRRHVRGYLEHEERWIEGFGGHTHYHRPLSWYVSRMAGAGLAVTGLAEPPSLPPHERPEWSEYERWFSEIPTMLAWSARQFPTPRPAMNADG